MSLSGIQVGDAHKQHALHNTRRAGMIWQQT